VGSGGRRKVSRDDYLAEGVIFLPETARFSCLLSLTDAGNDINRKIRANETLKCSGGEFTYRPHFVATPDQ
jgi:type I restriction enzyme M protein